jgi:geranylgeranyl reductase family protein
MDDDESAMNIWDAIVVGAGPAGCAAAYDLASNGKSVLIMDRCSFPRIKACAGGLTIKAVRALRYSITPVTCGTMRSMEVSKRFTSRSVLKGSQPICVMTLREELDAFCLRQTLAAGAEFRVIKSIRGLEQARDRATLSAEEGDFQARFIVGADGANSRVRQLCGDTSWFRRGFALEAQVPITSQSESFELDFGVVSDGYGWVFPKGNHVNVGLYSESCQQKIDRAALARYIYGKLGVRTFSLLVGQYLGMGGSRNLATPNRVLLVGDAAGLVDSLSGEGIYNAIVSGQAAAQAIGAELEGQGQAGNIFNDALREMRYDLDLCTRAARKFYGNLDWGYRALTLPVVRGAAARTLAHGMSYGRAMKRYSFVLPMVYAVRGETEPVL